MAARFHVAQSLEGTSSPHPGLSDCNQLAAKLFFHTATIYWLSQGTKAPVPEPDGADFYDFASIGVLTRATLETYLIMFEVFFEPTTDDDREFQHALWLLSGFVIREKSTPPEAIGRDRIAQSQREIEQMRDRIRNTSKFASLSDKQKRRVLDGKREPRSRQERLQAAGFGAETFQQSYGYLSGYVHADGLSGAQIIQAETKQAQLAYIQGAMHIVMAVMAKMILQYERHFAPARSVCLANQEAFGLAKVWAGGASLVP